MDVIIVGGGFAGMQSALTLKQLGVSVVLFERGDKLGGHVRNWHTLFPDMTPAKEVLSTIVEKVKDAKIEVRYNSEVVLIKDKSVTLASGEVFSAKAIIVCSGYKLFDARLKQEYGYGIYDRVVTSADLEQAFNEGRLEEIAGGKNPKNIAFVHCVGSRDEQVRQEHCSRVCCVTGVKQAIKVRKMFPNCEVYNFYMDIRMFGAGYEEMYRTAQQEHHVHFIRGRVSEVTPTQSGSVMIKTEDTLLSRPMVISADLLVLMIGMCAEDNNASFAQNSNMKLRKSGFMMPKNSFELSNYTDEEGVFIAGCASAPQNISETMNSASNSALEVLKYINR